MVASAGDFKSQPLSNALAREMDRFTQAFRSDTVDDEKDYDAFFNLFAEIDKTYSALKKTESVNELLKKIFIFEEAVTYHFLRHKKEDNRWLKWFMRRPDFLSSATKEFIIIVIERLVKNIRDRSIPKHLIQQEISEYGFLFSLPHENHRNFLLVKKQEFIQEIIKDFFRFKENDFLCFIADDSILVFDSSFKEKIFLDLLDTFLEKIPAMNRDELALYLDSVLKVYAILEKFGHSFFEEIRERIRSVFDLILVDHKKNSDVIAVCERHGINLLNAGEDFPLLVFNFLRLRAHKKIFNKPPRTFKQLPFEPSDEKWVGNLRPISSQKIRSVINGLTLENKAVSHVVFHWTDWVNFKSIIRSGYFYGNGLLKSRNIFFRKNALENADIKNGDGNVICFCPYLVDHAALTGLRLGKLKQGLVRVSIDLHQTDRYCQYRRFFKLTDLQAPEYDYEISLTKDLTLRVIKPGRDKNLMFIFTFNKKSYEIILSKEECVFYGSHFAINRFCLLQLFYAAQKHPELYQNLIPYLEQFDEAQLSQILIKAAKSTTVFSEYNFSGKLKLTPLLIKEIHFAEHNKTIDLRNLDSKSYDAALQKISGMDEKQALSEAQPRVGEPYVTVSNATSIRCYGVLFKDVFNRGSQPVVIDKIELFDEKTPVVSMIKS